MNVGDEVTVMYRKRPRRGRVRQIVPWTVDGAPSVERFTIGIDILPSEDEPYMTPQALLTWEEQGIAWVLGWGEDAEAQLHATLALLPPDGAVMEVVR